MERELEIIAKKIANNYNRAIDQTYRKNGYLVFNVNSGEGGYWVDNINNINTRKNMIGIKVSDDSTKITIDDVVKYIEIKFKK